MKTFLVLLALLLNGCAVYLIECDCPKEQQSEPRREFVPYIPEYKPILPYIPYPPPPYYIIDTLETWRKLLDSLDCRLPYKIDNSPWQYDSINCKLYYIPHDSYINDGENSEYISGKHWELK